MLGDLAPDQVRVRFPPSPTGNLHVGNVRSALFNWVFARHYGGTFVLRVEDTDAGRNLEESYQGLYDSLSWLGLTWDEGPLVGGPYSPYIQTERGDIYRDVVGKLLAATLAYRCYCTREEIELGRRCDRSALRPVTTGSAATSANSGSPSWKRCRFLLWFGCGCLIQTSPSTTWFAGRVRFAAAHVPDYVIVRGNGEPLYTLVNPVDDSLMKITHVLRGEDLLPSTPRQIVLYDALKQIEVGSGRTPAFGHLPTVLGEGNRRLSKRDKGSGLAEYQQKGYLPEGLLNYLALLGWGIAEDRDVFSLAEMVAAFDIRQVNASPARFDAKKCEAINAAHIRMLTPAELTEHLVPLLAGAGLIGEPPTPAERELGSRYAADPGAHQHALRGGRPAGLLVRAG